MKWFCSLVRSFVCLRIQNVQSHGFRFQFFSLLSLSHFLSIIPLSMISSICVSYKHTQHTAHVSSKQNKIGVNFSEFENYWFIQYSATNMHWFFFFYSSLTHSQFCWLNAHIVSEQTLYFAYFRIWMFSATKHLCVYVFFRSAHSLAHLIWYFFSTEKIWNSVQSVVECVKFNEPLDEWDWNGQIYCERARDGQRNWVNEPKNNECVSARVRKISSGKHTLTLIIYFVNFTFGLKINIAFCPQTTIIFKINTLCPKR